VANKKRFGGKGQRGLSCKGEKLACAKDGSMVNGMGTGFLWAWHWCRGLEVHRDRFPRHHPTIAVSSGGSRAIMRRFYY